MPAGAPGAVWAARHRPHLGRTPCAHSVAACRAPAGRARLRSHLSRRGECRPAQPRGIARARRSYRCSRGITFTTRIRSRECQAGWSWLGQAHAYQPRTDSRSCRCVTSRRAGAASLRCASTSVCSSAFNPFFSSSVLDCIETLLVPSNRVVNLSLRVVRIAVSIKHQGWMACFRHADKVATNGFD